MTSFSFAAIIDIMTQKKVPTLFEREPLIIFLMDLFTQ
jgi:hypothetical protein